MMMMVMVVLLPWHLLSEPSGPVVPQLSLPLVPAAGSSPVPVSDVVGQCQRPECQAEQGGQLGDSLAGSPL